MRPSCGCVYDDAGVLDGVCGQHDASGFPCPRGVAFVSKDATDLTAVFARVNAQEWSENLGRFALKRAASR